MLNEVPNLAAAQAYEAAASAWLAGHVAPVERSTIVEVGQRVAVCIDGRRRLGTVREIGRLGFARVEVDLGWMHEWLPLSDVSPIGESQPDDRLALGTTVTLANGVGLRAASAVVVAQSTCDGQRYQLAWFDRHFWRVRRGWYDGAQFTVGTNGAAENAAGGTALSA